jgi:hypothetical protein
METVGPTSIGNPDGVRKGSRERHPKGRMAGWEYEQDIAYLS